MTTADFADIFMLYLTIQTWWMVMGLEARDKLRK